VTDTSDATGIRGAFASNQQEWFVLPTPPDTPDGELVEVVRFPVRDAVTWSALTDQQGSATVYTAGGVKLGAAMFLLDVHTVRDSVLDVTITPTAAAALAGARVRFMASMDGGTVPD
jgi:hypothetical protein